jgi:hypothetical protein
MSQLAKQKSFVDSAMEFMDQAHEQGKALRLIDDLIDHTEAMKTKRMEKDARVARMLRFWDERYNETYEIPHWRRVCPNCGGDH